ncbi:PREDICTED: pro-corazonin-like [Polistes dominula]|uniref:Pro-corazonin n=1 Tax=Polistes dominula TaxID=743375 RepID=A0ABM1IAH6_POLDO|nr:PREDICTED: pro-corazonin-like [Polistes dominula]
MAIVYGATIVLVLSFLTTDVLCQTFQYSQGWTNGKRTPTEVTSQLLYPASSWMKNNFDSQFDNISPQTHNNDAQRMKLFHQGNVNEALCLLPCETNTSRKNLRENQQRKGFNSEGANNIYQM